MHKQFEARSLAFKKQIVAKFLSRGSKSVRILAKENGIAVTSFYKWTKQINLAELLLVEKEMSPNERRVEEKANLVFAYERLNEESKGEFLRLNGITSSHLLQWKSAMMDGITGKDSSKHALEHQVRCLEKELLRKDKALAEAASLLLLQKKSKSVPFRGRVVSTTERTKIINLIKDAVETGV